MGKNIKTFEEHANGHFYQADAELKPSSDAPKEDHKAIKNQNMMGDIMDKEVYNVPAGTTYTKEQSPLEGGYKAKDPKKEHGMQKESDVKAKAVVESTDEKNMANVLSKRAHPTLSDAKNEFVSDIPRGKAPKVEKDKIGLDVVNEGAKYANELSFKEGTHTLPEKPRKEAPKEEKTIHGKQVVNEGKNIHVTFESFIMNEQKNNEDVDRFATIILDLINKDDQQHELSHGDLTEMIMFPEDVAQEDMDNPEVRLADFRDGLDYMFMHRYVYDAMPSNEVIDIALAQAKAEGLNLPFYN